MYDTSLGIRVLYSAEARLFASSAWSLLDRLRETIPESEDQPYRHLTGIPALDSLTATQFIVLIDRVTAYLLDPDVEAPDRTALLDATIAAIFQHLSMEIEAEIYTELDVEDPATEAQDFHDSYRTKVVAVIDQIDGPNDPNDPDDPDLETPEPDCTEMDDWQFVIDRLCDRILPDADWQLESIMMDTDPNRSSAIKGRMGVSDDYLIDIAADASIDDAASAWCDFLQRITGWRPERWQFGGGIPIPDDAPIPPRIDVLSFSESGESPTGPEKYRPEFKQARPVLLSAVMFELEGGCDEWSQYLDRKNGEIVGLPTATIEFVEEGEDPARYSGEEGERFLELARRIVETMDFVPLPSQYDIHEWSIMRDFCNHIDSDSDRDALLEAVHGNGAFRHFKATIARLDLTDTWYEYRSSAIEGIVVDWLEANSIQWSRTPPGEPPF